MNVSAAVAAAPSDDTSALKCDAGTSVGAGVNNIEYGSAVDLDHLAVVLKAIYISSDNITAEVDFDLFVIL